jgi:tetratricopeptide (TPR) repeat protein
VQTLAPETEGIDEVVKELANIEAMGALTDQSLNGANNWLALLEQIDQAQSKGLWPQSIELLQQALHLAPDAPEADPIMLHNRLGYSYFLNGQLAEAEAEFLTAVDKDPENIAALNNLADLYLQQTQYDRATEYINRALKVDANDVNTLMLLGNCSIQVGAFDVALMAFQRVQARAPETEGIDAVITEMTAIEPNQSVEL